MADTFEVRAKEPDRYICWVGYDKSPRSYFVYVAERGVWNKLGRMEGKNHVVIWLGMSEREITSVAEVRSLLQPYAVLPAEIEEALKRASGEGVADVKSLEAVKG
jgi:hypothetical protein